MIKFFLFFLVGEGLGQPHYAMPFLAPNTTGRNILYGVNYASGGGGIMNATGRIFVRIGLLNVLIENKLFFMLNICV